MAYQHVLAELYVASAEQSTVPAEDQAVQAASSPWLAAALQSRVYREQVDGIVVDGFELGHLHSVLPTCGFELVCPDSRSPVKKYRTPAPDSQRAALARLGQQARSSAARTSMAFLAVFED